MNLNLLLLQHSWQQYLYVKCQNINRTPGGSKTDEMAPVPKRHKSEDFSKHLYPSLTAEVEDDTSNDRNKLQLVRELQKVKPQKEKLIELMRRTFGSRRKWIIDGAASVKEICTEYPLLKKSTHVSLYDKRCTCLVTSSILDYLGV